LTTDVRIIFNDCLLTIHVLSCLGTMRDLKGCAAIMKSSGDLKVLLTSKQHADFLELLTNRKFFRWKEPDFPVEKAETTKVEFKYKF
jgi:hypothetical protein